MSQRPDRDPDYVSIGGRGVDIDTSPTRSIACTPAPRRAAAGGASTATRAASVRTISIGRGPTSCGCSTTCPPTSAPPSTSAPCSTRGRRIHGARLSRWIPTVEERDTELGRFLTIAHREPVDDVDALYLDMGEAGA